MPLLLWLPVIGSLLLELAGEEEMRAGGRRSSREVSCVRSDKAAWVSPAVRCQCLRERE